MRVKAVAPVAARAKARGGAIPAAAVLDQARVLAKAQAMLAAGRARRAVRPAAAAATASLDSCVKYREKR